MSFGRCLFCLFFPDSRGEKMGKTLFTVTGKIVALNFLIKQKLLKCLCSVAIFTFHKLEVKPWAQQIILQLANKTGSTDLSFYDDKMLACQWHMWLFSNAPVFCFVVQWGDGLSRTRKWSSSNQAKWNAKELEVFSSNLSSKLKLITIVRVKSAKLCKRMSAQ